MASQVVLADGAETTAKENNNRGILSVINPLSRMGQPIVHCFIINNQNDIKNVKKCFDLGSDKQNEWPKDVKSYVAFKFS